MKELWQRLKKRLAAKKRSIPAVELEGIEYLKDGKGRFIPVSSVPDHDIKRDILVREIAAEALKIEELLAMFKVDRIADVHAFVAMMAEESGVKLGGEKGNITLAAYDGSLKVMVAISDYIEFDERLNAAKQLFDEMIQEGTESSPDWLRTILLDAFDVKKGYIDTKKMLGLTRLKIDHPKGIKAQSLILRSIRITSSKEYLRIYKRDDKGKYKLVNLDLARATCDTADKDDGRTGQEGVL